MDIANLPGECPSSQETISPASSRCGEIYPFSTSGSVFERYPFSTMYSGSFSSNFRSNRSSIAGAKRLATCCS